MYGVDAVQCIKTNEFRFQKTVVHNFITVELWFYDQKEIMRKTKQHAKTPKKSYKLFFSLLTIKFNNPKSKRMLPKLTALLPAFLGKELILHSDMQILTVILCCLKTYFAVLLPVRSNIWQT